MPSQNIVHRQVLAVFLLVSLLAFPRVSNSQQAPATDANLASMSFQRFEEWFLTQLLNADKERQKPNVNLEAVSQTFKSLDQAALARLKAGQTLRDSTLLTLVQYQGFLEQSIAARATPPTKPSYSETFSLITQIQEKVEDSSPLSTELHLHLARLMENSNNSTGALLQYEKALPILDQMRLKADVQRISTLVAAAEIAVKTNDLKKADGYYLQAFSYPWYKVRSADEFQTLKKLYIQAGLGLIKVRQGDLKALKEIYVAPAAKGDLTPPLEAAIKLAK